jgi:hypothetical protein
MQKVVQFLEKYVQWLAIALGLAFLGFMGWSYVYKNPAAQVGQIGGQSVEVTPGDVDKKIDDETADTLERETRQQHPDFTIAVPRTDKIDIGPTTKPVEVAAFDSWSFDLSNFAPMGGPQRVVVVALPTLPPLAYVDQEPLRTVLLITPPNGNPIHQDEDSVTTFWSLPIADLAKAFKDSFAGRLPERLQMAQFIRATVVRQELMPDGQWGGDTVVAEAPLPPGTQPEPEYPKVTDPNAAVKFNTYLAWVNPLQTWVVNAADPPTAFPQRADLQWQPLAQWIPYRAEAQAAENTPVNQPLPPPIAPPAPPQQFQGGPGFGGPRPGGRPPGAIFGGGEVGNSVQTMLQPSPQQQPAVPASQPTTNPTVVIPPIPQLQAVPAQGFNPTTSLAQGDMGLWFHDMNAEPGKTYRYKVRYTLYNPVFGQPNAAADPKMADNLGMDSPFSGWSDNVVVPPRVRFWCMGKQPPPVRGQIESQVGFSCYSWHDGLWQQKDYIDSAGDEIGADEGGAGNFLTHWTILEDLAGFRAKHNVVIVPDDGGPAQLRDVDGDTKSMDYLRFKRDFDNQQSLLQQQPQQGGPNPPNAPG